ncbi:Thioredoxin-disulfide reductase [Desulforamulus reducens MI-1]|uniref:Thioredoxin-disulfide reductase n=1 Tax=Desulforamulus reducens (strain ATCC BAA-1160 / DSM 100696 / MI-1) TaxID=349161 RepID=A4J5C1_DESRM|nr:NAD(P)/FAD-dependent oxidoreductase [Desulforamulus reducens]ABO50274.1 Thioredoxin-disulfide reductase [Desulforamulus reducens MI-1]
MNEMNIVSEYDIAIVGCGPAGLSAAINAVIRKKKIGVFGTEFCSPKLHHAPHVDNYLGFQHITGEDLRLKFLNHAKDMGITINKNKVTGVFPDKKGFTLQSRDKFYLAKSVILATGVSTLKPIEQEIEYLGRGVSYCATCDGPLYKGKKVIVLAYNREGLEEANFLAELASEVILVSLVKEKDSQGIRLSDNISRVNGKPQAIIGEMWASGVALENEKIYADGIFIIRESVLPDQLVPGLEVSQKGILVERSGATNIPGIFAAGDCIGAPYQLSKATGEGQVAALSAVKYLDEFNYSNKEEAEKVSASV